MALTKEEVRSWDPARCDKEANERVRKLKLIKDKNGGHFSGIMGKTHEQAKELTADIEVIHERLNDEPANPMQHPRMRNGSASTDIKDVAALTKDQSVESWVKAKGHVRREDEHLSLGKAVRGLAIGDWKDADAERKAMTEGVLAEGGHLVPTPLAARVIDLARAATRVIQAGALSVPMTSQKLKIARQATDPNASWHAEGAPIADSAITFDSVELVAQTLPVMVKFSRELFEDAPNADTVVERSIAEATALELDRVALYGSGVAPEPLGIKNTTGVTITTFGAPDGAVPANYDHYVDAFQVLRAANHDPSAVIQAPRSEATLGKLADSTGQPLREPRQVEEVRRHLTNQIRTDLTVGVNADTSDLFVAAWQELLIGQRISFSINFLSERFADTGEFALLSWMRADIAVARPAAFNVVEGIRA